MLEVSGLKGLSTALNRSKIKGEQKKKDVMSDCNE